MRYLLAVAVAALLATSAHADDWQTVEIVTGMIVRVDFDTIRRNKDGGGSAEAPGGGTVFFDCMGHMSGIPSRSMTQHVARSSVNSTLEALVCAAPYPKPN
jgi:hypothetical protein